MSTAGTTQHIPSGIGAAGPTPRERDTRERERDQPSSLRTSTSGHGVGSGSIQEHTLPGAAGGGGSTSGSASGVGVGGVSSTHHGGGSVGSGPSGGAYGSGHTVSGGESMTEQATKHLPYSAQEQGRYMAEQGRQTMEQGREMAAPYIEKGKELKEALLHKASETTSQVQHQMHAASDAACDALRDSRGFVRRHPWAILTLLSTGMVAGFALSMLGLTLGWLGKQMFGGHPYGSPQYEAHKSLDTILQSTFGTDSGWMGQQGGGGGLASLGGWGSGGATDSSGALGSLSKLTGLGGQQQHPQHQAGSWLQGLTSQMQQQQPSRVQDAYHFVDDTWRNVKDRMMPESRGASDQIGGGMTGFLGGVKDRVLHPFGGGGSEWQKVEQAEQRLREALHAASHRGSR